MMFWNGRKSLLLFAALFLIVFLPVPILSSSNCGSCELSASSCSSSSSSEEEPADCGKFTNFHLQVLFLLFLGECRPPTTLTYCKKPVGIVISSDPIADAVSTFYSLSGDLTFSYYEFLNDLKFTRLQA